MQISIISPCLNRAAYIEDAIQSVLSQNCPEVEHIVVDGGSTDGTLEILGRYPHLRVISEQDSGMYDAINKGLSLASGDIIGFLNTDDLFAPGAFGAVVNAFRDSDVDAVVGAAAIFRETSGKQEIVSTHVQSQDDDLLYRSTLDSTFFNAWFFRRRVFDQIGQLNNRYRIAADADFIFRFGVSKLSRKVIDAIIYYYRFHPGSLTFDITYSKLKTIADEILMMAKDYLQQDSLASSAKEYIRKMQRQWTLQLALQSLQNKSIDNLIKYAWIGMTSDFLWPFRLLKLVSGFTKRFETSISTNDSSEKVVRNL